MKCSSTGRGSHPIRVVLHLPMTKRRESVHTASLMWKLQHKTTTISPSNQPATTKSTRENILAAEKQTACPFTTGTLLALLNPLVEMFS
jgi:hypothetical protein